MIRFCDKEICCITEADLDRQQLLNWFFDGHREEPICLLDETGKFIGTITYDSLLGKDMEEAIRKNYVVFDKEIWENGRRYFRNVQRNFAGSLGLLPVLNKEHELICFAYEDSVANREIRMLDELMECGAALGFKDVYPEYDCVVIQGFNELAFYLKQYLENTGVLVVTEGVLWREFGLEVCRGGCLDYRIFTVYAEGIGCKEKQINLRNSVSVEFECIDHIYEENICKGFLKDTQENFAQFIDRLAGEKVCILGTDEPSLNAYDLLLRENVEIYSFVSDDPKERQRIIFEKPVKKTRDIIDDAIIIDAYQKHSALGTDVVNDYHYLGCKRNQRFFLLQDYTDVIANGLRNILKYMFEQPSKRLILIGDLWLCLKLKKTLEKTMKICGKIVFCDIFKEYKKTERRITEIDKEQLREGDTCLLLLPEYYGIFVEKEIGCGRRSYLEKERERYLKELKDYDIRDVVCYSLDNSVFYEEENAGETHKTAEMKIGKILLGTSEGFNGNIFFGGIMENHPDILVLPWGYLADNLYSICIRLSVEKRDHILSSFWMWSNQEWSCSEKESFERSLSGMLNRKEFFTSQELFVMIHIAYALIQGKEIKDLSNLAIYWEPHFTPRDKAEDYAMWLNNVAGEICMINLVRDSCIRAGSFLRCNEKDKAGNNLEEFQLVLGPPEVERKEYPDRKRIVMRFEDVKRYPRKELAYFCEETGLPWADEMLDAKSSYDGIIGFDLTPVYRTYEEYFSAFDRFRISLITGPWQKKYGYPYVSMMDFGRRELEELFLKKFRFEERIVFRDNEEKDLYQNRRRRWLARHLWEVRSREVMEGANQNDTILR